jgi:hypothetical protein
MNNRQVAVRSRTNRSDPARIRRPGHRTKDADLGFSNDLDACGLASMAGASQETVTRVLNKFERDGIIARIDSIFTIPRRSQLEKLANWIKDRVTQFSDMPFWRFNRIFTHSDWEQLIGNTGSVIDITELSEWGA